MKNILYIILISLFSLTVISCSSSDESASTTTDTTAPVIAEVTAVTTPATDTTPAYTFSSNEAGTITYGGSCTSSTTSATSDNNTVTFSTLSVGTYSDCTIKVTDSSSNVSNTLTISSFLIHYKAVAVTEGNNHACALLDNGSMQCWGYAANYRLGNGSTTSQSSPVNVSNIDNATAIAAGLHTCALLSGGTIKCWGSGNYGQLGNGSASDSLIPVSVSNISTAIALSSRGGSQFHCALLSGGLIQCWGTDDAGKLGDGGTITSGNSINSEPVYVVGFGQ